MKKGKRYGDNGKLIFEGEFFNGKKIKGKEYYNGKLMFEGEYLYYRRRKGKEYNHGYLV